MLNSVSFSSMPSSSVAPTKRGRVVVNGQSYPVIKVPYKDPTKCTFAPEYREVVIIDGKPVPVEQVSDRGACDKTKDVVVIDGEAHNVDYSGLGEILGGIKPTFNVLA